MRRREVLMCFDGSVRSLAFLIVGEYCVKIYRLNVTNKCRRYLNTAFRYRFQACGNILRWKSDAVPL